MTQQAKIVLSSILGAILATGILALNPSIIGNTKAQMYANINFYKPVQTIK